MGLRLEEAESLEIIITEYSHTLRVCWAWSHLLWNSLFTDAVIPLMPRCRGLGREDTILQQSQNFTSWRKLLLTRPRWAETTREDPLLLRVDAAAGTVELCRSWQSRRAGAQLPPLCSAWMSVLCWGAPGQAEQAGFQRTALGILVKKENKVIWGKKKHLWGWKRNKNIDIR